MIKAWRIQGSFGLDHLELGTHERQSVSPDEIRIRLRAVSLNYRDLMMVEGQYNPRQPLPLVPCSDAVGEVIERGENVARFEVGDRVAPIFAQRWLAGEPTRERLRATLGGPLDGTLQEEIVISAEGAVAVPDHLSDEQAATLPCAAVTAWHALTSANVGSASTILVLGTGGVSIFALQLARCSGARVIVTSSQEKKLEKARELGAWETIPYLEVPDWHQRVLELTDGLGVDAVIEVGGAGTLERSISSVRLGGTVTVIGVLAGISVKIPVTSILMRNLRLQGILVGHRDHFENLCRTVDAHQLVPVVDRVFEFEDAPAAFKYLASAAHFGKVVLKITD